MSKATNSNGLESIDYDNFIVYFELHYRHELSIYCIYERRIEYLRQLKRIALEHRYIYELRHGLGSYNANLGKYGALNRTPLQIIEGDFNTTHLLMPKLSHTYKIRYKSRERKIPNNLRWAGSSLD